MIRGTYTLFHELSGVSVKQQPQVCQMLGKADLCTRLNVSERTIENLVKQGKFPPPVRIGKYVYWSQTAIAKWQERLFAAQESWVIH